MSTAAAALVLFALGFVPFVAIIPGGERARWLGNAWSEWGSGTLIVAGVTVVILMVMRRMPSLAAAHPLHFASRSWSEHPRLWNLGLPLLAALVYAVIARLVFDGRPLFIDEIIQLLQTRIFSEGRLSRAVDADPALQSVLLVADVNGRYFAQFPAGGPAVHLPGWLLGVPWMTVPLCGALAVGLFARWMRATNESPDVAPVAMLLYAAAPFWIFMAGSHMNHVPTTLMLMGAMSGLATLVKSGGAAGRPGAALLTGLGLGAAATIRPVDALAFAIPAAFWLLWRARRLDRAAVLEAFAALAGVLLPLAALFWVNARTTGSPLRFGYDLLWGRDVGLGFHSAPWGVAHTVSRGLELLNLYVLRLQLHLFETPFPALIPAIVALVLWRRVTAFDRYLLASGAALLLLYAAYWHDGNYLGPRFLTPLVPALCLWSARAGGAIRDRLGQGMIHRAWVIAMGTGAFVALVAGVPVRARAYARSAPALRWNADSASAAAGVRDAVVFVRESWGAALIARMWALGVSRPATEYLYSRVDACRLEHAVSALERTGVRDSRATARLLALAQRSGVVIPSPFSPDASERFEPGVTYDAVCGARLAEDRAGFTMYAPLTLARDGNLYLRDLGPTRNRAALARHPGKRAFLLRPESADGRAAPRYFPLGTD